MLENATNNNSIDGKKRAVSNGLYETILRKDIIATAILFKEVFSITGPLNTYLQSVEMDFGQANALVAAALEQLQKLRDDCSRVTEQVKKFDNLKWDKEVQRTCRNKNNTDDFPEVIWLREVFYPVLDQIKTSIKSRFDQNKDIFDAISLFSPKRFASILDNYMNVEDLADDISVFCNNYGVNSIECAKELLSFAAAFPKLKNVTSFPKRRKADVVEFEDEVEETDVEEPEETGDVNKRGELVETKTHSYHHALDILANPLYHLIDAYPLLYKSYGLILAIPITSCTAERTFSVLKRVKSRLRATMDQGRLENLLMMAIEREIINSMDRNETIDRLGK